jgi:hypothetical protein
MGSRRPRIGPVLWQRRTSPHLPYPQRIIALPGLPIDPRSEAGMTSERGVNPSHLHACRGCQWIPALRFAPAGMTSEKKARSGPPPPFRPSVLGLDPALRAHTTLMPSPPARRSRDRGPNRFQSGGGETGEAAQHSGSLAETRPHTVPQHCEPRHLPRPPVPMISAGVANGPPVKPRVTAEEEAGTCVTAAASKQGDPRKGMRLALSPAGGRRPERMAGDGLAGNRLPRKNSPTRESCMTGSEGQPEGRGASASAREAGAHRLRPGKPPTGRVA